MWWKLRRACSCQQGKSEDPFEKTTHWFRTPKKTITFCPSYMKPDVKKGVERRAAALPAEYTKKARDTDLDYCGTDPGTMGPVETHLKTRYPDILKLVIGPTAEISADFHELLHTMGESKIQHDARATGRQESDWAFASQLS